MPRPATYDKDRLLELMRDHPEWRADVLAAELTAWNETHGRPGVKVNPPTIAMAISRLRESGADVPGIWSEVRPLDTDSLVKQLIANTGRQVAAAHMMHVSLRCLRTWDSLAKDRSVSELAVANARRFEVRLRRLKRVVDIDVYGCPVERAATPAELKAQSLIALPVPQDDTREPDKDQVILRLMAENEALRMAVKALGGYSGRRRSAGLPERGGVLTEFKMLEWFDREGRSITLEEWSKHKGDPAYNLVAFSRLRGHMVHTMWTGLEPAATYLLPKGTDRPHLIFETVVAGPSGPIDLEDGGVYRWFVTEEHARTGHYDAVAWLAAVLGAVPADAESTTDYLVAAQWWSGLFPEWDRQFRELYGGG